MIGSIPLPPDFRYRDVLLKGRPLHRPGDSFSIRHPAMDLSRRAKLFQPFDALKGFREAVAETEAAAAAAGDAGQTAADETELQAADENEPAGPL